MKHEAVPNDSDKRSQLEEWVHKYAPGAKERQLQDWLQKHGGADEMRRTIAENELWAFYRQSEGISDAYDAWKRAESMGLKEESARLRELYEVQMSMATEGYETLKLSLFNGVEAALKSLQDEMHHEEGEWKQDTAYVPGINEATFRYLAQVLGKPEMLSNDLEVDYEEGPDVSFIVLEERSPDAWVILREDGVVEYLTDDAIGRARKAKQVV